MGQTIDSFLFSSTTDCTSLIKFSLFNQVFLSTFTKLDLLTRKMSFEDLLKTYRIFFCCKLEISHIKLTSEPTLFLLNFFSSFLNSLFWTIPDSNKEKAVRQKIDRDKEFSCFLFYPLFSTWNFINGNFFKVKRRYELVDVLNALFSLNLSASLDGACLFHCRLINCFLELCLNQHIITSMMLHDDLSQCHWVWWARKLESW